MQQKFAHLIQRYNPAALWSQYNPVLLKGELGIESDTHKAKLGDGVTAWNSLDYFVTNTSTQMYVAGNGAIISADGILSASLQYEIV